jgi:Tetratricopeptide repeat
VDQIVGTHEIKLTKEQFQKIRAIPFQYQLRRPLVPGKYNFTMIISNNVSKKNATFVRSIDIPNLSGSPYITPLIPVLSVDDAPQDGKIRPFQFGNKILSPNITGTYSQKGTMEVYHQVIFPEKYSPTGKLALHYAIKSSESTVELEFTDPITMTGQQLAGNFIEVRKPIPLSKLNFGNKQLFVQLMDDQKVIFSTEPILFSVQTEASTSVWQFAVATPAPETGFDNFILGQQLARLDRLDESMALLNDARRKNPDNVDIALQMMRVALRQRNYEKTQQIGIPLEVKNPRNKDLLWLMGWASYERQKYDDAVRYFERFRMENPKSIQALNLLADSYYRLQQPQKSLERVQESLAIKPDQKDILELKQKLQSNR